MKLEAFLGRKTNKFLDFAVGGITSGIIVLKMTFEFLQFKKKHQLGIIQKVEFPSRSILMNLSFYSL